MFRYTTTYINLVSFVISTSIFLIINLIFSNINSILPKATFKAGFIVNNSQNQTNEDSQLNSNINTDSNQVTEDKIDKSTEEQIIKEEDEWYLEIPCIGLKANIKEGTTKAIMDDYIGHFEETSKDLGNVGLAAHNRGYKNNYFENLKKLEEGEVIQYKYKNLKREYVVEKHIIIKDTDSKNLKDTDENIITLITCVENQPEYRRCIQGIEKESEEF